MSRPLDDALSQRSINQARVEKSLKRRHAREQRFRLMGLAAVLAGLAFVALLFISILARGLPAFWQSTITTEVYFDPQIIDIEPRPVFVVGESQQSFQERDNA